MEIRSGLEGLKSLLGVNESTPTAAGSKSDAATVGLSSDHVTFSSAANEVSVAASEDSVRTDKVAQIQRAIAGGTYSVSASAVASRVVDAMLNAQK